MIITSVVLVLVLIAWLSLMEQKIQKILSLVLIHLKFFGGREEKTMTISCGYQVCMLQWYSGTELWEVQWMARLFPVTCVQLV